jgi:SAM-dependent methyltransferase
MNTEIIQRQYNEVVASHYDLDPQGVIRRSLERAADQLRRQRLFEDGPEPLKVLDVGLGTGLFLEKLKAQGGDQLRPFGLDLSEKMVAYAHRRIPDLVSEVDDALNLDAVFPGHHFDCVCSHFLTGFVPMHLLAPKVWNRLEDGGYWSLVGGTKAGFPVLQAKANARVLRWRYGAGAVTLDDIVCNPADRHEIVRILEANGFEVCLAETFEPSLEFRDYHAFMEFAYRGGWLTPIVEAIGLHQAGALTRWLLNRFLFPVQDHHSIAIVLARKPRDI